ncbi:GDF3 factor, partial [Erithacus rubecula]|nr:GDF3 factor [Erithacus rubecula]
CAGRAGMWLLRSLAWALLSPVLFAELSRQESSLLRSLGLSAKPSPASPAPVPPALWRMFQRREALPRPRTDRDPCRVEELSVPGDIVRVFADQGTATPRSGLSRRRAPAPLLPAPGPLQEKSRLCRIPADSVGDGLWVWNPLAG